MNSINSQSLLKISQEIENEANDIANRLNRIQELIKLFQNNFNTNNARKTCTILVENNIKILKNYNDKVSNMKLILDKINNLYKTIDNEFSNKNII